MRKYKIVIDFSALEDIHNATKWYDLQSKGLGGRFKLATKRQINQLKNTPASHHIRYADVRCVLVKKFPFLVHFIIDEAQFIVEIFAVIHTSRNPKIWEQRRG